MIVSNVGIALQSIYFSWFSVCFFMYAHFCYYVIIKTSSCILLAKIDPCVLLLHTLKNCQYILYKVFLKYTRITLSNNQQP